MHLAALDTNKDEPLRNDIRLLGRILGDTVREQLCRCHGHAPIHAVQLGQIRGGL